MSMIQCAVLQYYLVQDGTLNEEKQNILIYDWIFIMENEARLFGLVRAGFNRHSIKLGRLRDGRIS